MATVLDNNDLARLEEGTVCSKSKLEPKNKKLTTTQAVSAITSLYLSTTLIQCHYALAQGGWVMVVVLAFLVFFTGVAGILIADSAAAVSAAGVTDASFAAIGQAACGRWGRWSYELTGFVEILLVVAVMSVSLWDQVEALIPASFRVPSIIVGAVCISASLPLMLTRDLSFLARLQSIGLAALLFIFVVVVVAVGLFGTTGWDNLEVVSPNSTARGIFTGTSIFLGALGGHSALPAIRSGMQEPEQFKRCFIKSYAAVFACMALMSIIGYLLVGRRASILITDDLHHLAAAHHSKQGEALEVLTVMSLVGICIKLYTVIPLVNSILSMEYLASILRAFGMQLAGAADRRDKSSANSEDSEDSTPSPSCRQSVALRATTFLLASALGLLLRDNLAELSVLLGLLGLFTTLLLPGLFYFQLHRGKWGLAPNANLGSINGREEQTEEQTRKQTDQPAPLQRAWRWAWLLAALVAALSINAGVLWVAASPKSS